MSRYLIAAVLLAAFLPLVGCGSYSAMTTPRADHSTILLNENDFEVTAPHAVGKASCTYIIGIPMGNTDVVSQAWMQMKTDAAPAVDGNATQFVNVTQERTKRWSFGMIYYQDHCTVSADAITFK